MSRLDCRTCGACCTGPDSWEIAYCTVADVRRMSRSVRAQLVDRSGRSIGSRIEDAITPSDADGKCVFLRGTVGGRVSCRIYNTRPDVCRKFEPGSRGCRDARRQEGIA